jgi:hypothetical protein
MAARAARDAASALRSELERQVTAPPQGVFARAATVNAAAEELLQLWTGIEHELTKLENLHDEHGKRIEAWQEVPPGSAQSIAEARGLVEAVDEELGKLKGLTHRLDKAMKLAKRLQGLTGFLETIQNDVAAWLKDTETDKQNLLVAARALIVRDQNGANSGNGVIEIPLHVQVERALADAHSNRESRNDDSLGLKLLPNADEKRALASRLLRKIDEEIELQKQLEARVFAALDAARDAGAPPPPELRTAADQLRAWGQGLAFERSRIESFTR